MVTRDRKEKKISCKARQDLFPLFNRVRRLEVIDEHAAAHAPSDVRYHVSEFWT